MTTAAPNPDDIDLLFYVFGSYKETPLNNETLQAIERVGVNIRDEDGMTLLMKAAENGNMPNINFLLDKGAQINDADYRGITALHHAFNDGPSDECVQRLIEAGADLEAKDNEGLTPLTYGLSYGGNKEDDADALMVLITSGADLETGNGIVTLCHPGSRSSYDGELLGQTAREALLNPENDYPERLVNCVCVELVLRSRNHLKEKVAGVEAAKSDTSPRVM